MALDPAFLADCLYEESGVLIDEVMDVNLEESSVRARMPTSDDLPLTRSQRVDAVRHPRHVSGGLMVHMTGVAAYVHFYYVLGLRRSLGWTGYGVRIHDARFSSLALPGDPLILECKATRIRRFADRISARYRFEFCQAGRRVFEGDQSALWLKVGT